MVKNKLIEEWQEAAQELGLEIVVGFSLKLPSGNQINTDLLLLNFGDDQGMLIVRKFEQLEPWLDEIDECGYGFSVLDEPDQPFDRCSFIDMLKDWGWVGPIGKQPDWLKS